MAAALSTALLATTAFIPSANARDGEESFSWATRDKENSVSSTHDTTPTKKSTSSPGDKTTSTKKKISTYSNQGEAESSTEEREARSSQVSGFEIEEFNDGVVIIGLGDKEISDGKLTIPKEIDGKKVIEIADGAFQDKGIKTLVFESTDTLDKIGDNAFQGNSISGDVELHVRTIGGNAFAQNDISSLSLHDTKEVGADAFRDNKITSIDFSNSKDVILKDRAFINNRIKGDIDLKNVGEINDEAFSTNFIKEAILGDNTTLGSDVFAKNKVWIKLVTTSGSDDTKGITTQSYDSQSGQVVDPVSIVVHYQNDKGDSIAPDETVGDNLETTKQAFEKGKEATYTPRKIQGYRLDTPEITFTPDKDGYEITAKYTKVDLRPTITLPSKGFEIDNGATLTKDMFLKRVTAKSKSGEDLTSKIKVDYSNVNPDAPGIYDVIYTVSDKDGNERIETAKATVGINYPDYEFGNGWQIKDFTYDGSTVTGFSDSGQKKLASGKTELWIPPFTEDGTTVESIGKEAFEKKGLTSISGDWGNVRWIGSYAFQDNQLTSFPDNWDKVSFIDKYAFEGNQLTSLPDNWGEISSITDYTFADNQLTSLPDDWGKITSIGDRAFWNNRLTSLPDDWGKVTKIGKSAFYENQLTSLPDDWGKITSIDYGVFMENQLTSIPDDWGKITSIGDRAFWNNRLTSLPDDWGKVTKIGKSAFYENQLTSLPDDWGKVTKIGKVAFYENQLTSLPDNWGEVTEIGQYAFQKNQLASLPDSWGEISSIAGYAFADNQLTSLPDDWGKITSIEERAFWNNQLISLPDNWGEVTKIGKSAFERNQLTSLPDDWGKVTKIGESAFYENQLTSLPDDWSEVSSIADYTFSNNKLTSLPDNWDKVTKIGKAAFSENQLTSLPNSWGEVSEIGKSAFQKNQLVSLPDSWDEVTTIDDQAFYDNQLTALPDDWGKVVSIGNLSFGNNRLPENLIFTLPSENLTSEFISDVNSSRIPRPITFITHDRTNPNNIKSTDDIRINPVDVKYVFVDEEGNEIAPSLTETKSSDEKVTFTPPLLDHLGYKATKSSIGYTVARKDTQTIKVVYSKSDVKEDTKTNISLELNNDDPYLIGDSMTGRVRIDRTGYDTEPLVNSRVYFTLDPSVYDLNSVDITTSSLNIDKSTFKREGNTFSFVVPLLNPAQSTTIPFRVKFKKKVTPSKTKFPVVATLVDNDGNIVRTSEPDSFVGYYRNPYQRVRANGEKKNGLIDDYEQTIVSNDGEDPDAYVADDREGERVRNTITYNIRNINLDRNVGDYETRVYLPKYTVHEKSKLYDSNDPTRLAKFDPELNPGWKISDDGTYVTFKGTRNNTSVDFTDTLVLGYPGSVENKRIPLKSETTLVPFNKPNTEPVMLTTDTTTNHFARYTPPPGKIIAKFATGNHGPSSSNYFYDNSLERNGTFGWTIPFNAVETFHDAVFTDFDLDPRMYYDTVTIPQSLGKVEVRAIDDRGAILESHMIDGSERTATFEKNKVINADKLEMQLIDHPLAKGTSDIISLTSRLKDPDTPIYGDEKQNTIFGNRAQLDAKEGNFGPVYAQKTVREQNQEIVAFKTQQGYNSNGDKVDSIITDDNIRYTVGFTPREGFGETITNITEVDLLPLGVDVENVEMAPQFAQLPGASYEVVENYNETGQTAIVFKASSATAQELNPGNRFSVGYITVKTSMTVPDGKINNDVYVKAQNTELANKVVNPPAGPGEWSYANVWTNYTAASDMSARKQIRTYDDKGDPKAWTSSVTTDPGALLDYKLRLDNGTENERGDLVIYDVFPHKGDVGIPNKRESFFSNTYDPTRKPTIPDGYTIQYYNGDNYPTHSEGVQAQSESNKVLSNLKWENTPSKKTKAIKIVQNKGVTIKPRQRIEFILPMRANAERLDEFGNPPSDLVGPSAYNTFFWKDDHQPQLIEGNRVENKLRKKPASIELKKVDENGKSLPGARFELKNPEGDVVASAVSGDDGMVKFDSVNVEPGYTVSEVQAPKGYQVSDRVITITLAMMKKAYASSPVVITLKDYTNVPTPPAPTYGEVEFNKVDAKGNPLPGTKFKLSERYNSSNSYVGVANKDGKVIIAGIKPGTYTLEETTPIGNLQPIEDISNIKVEGDKTTYLGETVDGKEHVIVNNKVNIEFVKLGVNDDRIYTNGKPKPFGEYQLTDGSKLSGAQFEVVEDETDKVISKVTSSSSSYNNIKINNLTPYVVYRLNETATPSGYEKIDGLDLRFMVSEKGELLDPQGNTLTVQSGLIVPNKRKTQDSVVTVNKVDQDGNPVAGAKFVLQKFVDGRFVKDSDPKTTPDDGVLSWTIKDSNRYRIVETETPQGYSGKYVSPEFFTIRDKQQTFNYAATNKKVEPEVAKVEYIAQNLASHQAAQDIKDDNPGSVIEKSNGNYNVVRYLEGAVLELRENDAQGTLVQTLTTGKDGKAKVTVPVDPEKTYVLVETKAPEGYELRKKTVSFNATTRMATDPEAKDGRFTVYVPNYKKVGRITVSKLDESTHKPLVGLKAEFKAVKVEKVDNKQDGDFTIDGTYYRPVDSGETKNTQDSSGVAVFDNLEYGTYIVQETKSPQGYLKDSTPALFVVDENNAAHTFVFSNKPENPEIKVTKYINGHDANTKASAVWLDNDAETMDVKVVVENTGNTPLEKVQVTDIIKGAEDQYINDSLGKATYTVKDKSRKTIKKGVANGSITLNPGDTAEVTVNVKSPEKNVMHRDDVTATGYYGEKKVTDDDPAHSYRIPDVLKFILPATGVVPRVAIMLLIAAMIIGSAVMIKRRRA